MRLARNKLLLVLPYLLMIITNESIKPTVKEKPYRYLEVTAINSDFKMLNKCSWIGHRDTNYCKDNHVKILKPYLDTTDVFYFGEISLLRATGSYRIANIFFLILVCPLIIWYSLIKIIDYLIEINKLKKSG